MAEPWTAVAIEYWRNRPVVRRTRDQLRADVEMYAASYIGQPGEWTAEQREMVQGSVYQALLAVPAWETPHV